MPKSTMGYPLPSGEAFTDDLECLMVFYPDKPEYRQAFFGAYFYLSNWLAWERDSAKRGKDAARAWKLAVEATLECIEMGTCQNILELLTLVEENTRQCWCAIANDPTGGQNDTDDVVDGVGNVPQNIIDAGYATGTSDWAGFDDYKCMISHVMVDLIEQTIRDIIPHMDDNGKIIGGIGVVVAVLGAILLSGGTFILALGVLTATGVAAAVWGLFNEMTKAGMETLADDVSDNHDDLACAIYLSDGIDDAIDDLNDEIDALFPAIDAAILKNLNIGPRLRALYAGRYDQQDLADNMANASLDPDDYVCSLCGIPDLPSGASGYPIDIISVSSPTVPGSGWTLHELSTDGTSVFFDVTKATDSGAYCYLDIVCGPSPYWSEVGAAGHRGIAYHGARYTHGSAQVIQAEAGYLQDGVYAGSANQNLWYLLCSSPGAGYDTDLATEMGISWQNSDGTHGLDQTADQNRTLRLRFWWKDINQSNYRAQMRVTGLHWALNNV